jgi:hypothetical protein
MAPRGLYVETPIRAPMEALWEHTQDPSVRQRWDLRFSRIEYLPRPSLDEPQRFLYETRIGFGLAVAGAPRLPEAGGVRLGTMAPDSLLLRT